MLNRTEMTEMGNQCWDDVKKIQKSRNSPIMADIGA